MLILHTKITNAETIAGQLVLTYEQREKSRLRAALTSGEEVAVLIERGTVLRDGELLRGDDGRVVQIVAALEPTYRVECKDLHALLRCAFHLGNRHTQTQVAISGSKLGYLRIKQDSVLKDMLQGLGATVTEEDAAFEPESGAYSSKFGGGHHHGDGAHSHLHNLLAPVPLRQKIHRPSDPK